jgi:hemoglobin
MVWECRRPSGRTLAGVSDATDPGDERRDLGSEADVERLVRDFYRQAAVDDVLGPVFEAAEVDWAAHVPRVTEFWTWQLLGGRRYEGRPLRSHERVNDLVPFTEAHYERWLELFCTTLHDSWAGPVTDTADRRARRMARSMRRVLAGQDDPDPTWPDEGAGPARTEPGDGVEAGPSGGLVMRVALGPVRRGDGATP